MGGCPAGTPACPTDPTGDVPVSHSLKQYLCRLQTSQSKPTKVNIRRQQNSLPLICTLTCLYTCMQQGLFRTALPWCCESMRSQTFSVSRQCGCHEAIGVDKQAESAYLLEVLLAGILISWPHIRAVGACPMRVLKGYTGRWHAGGRQAMGGQGPRAVGLLMPWPHPRSHRSVCGLQCTTVSFMSKKQKSYYMSDADCKQIKQSFLLFFEMTMIGQSGFVGCVTFS